MTYGTSRAFKSGDGLAIIISKAAVREQKLEAGHTVEYDIRKCDIPKIKSNRGNNFNKPVTNEMNEAAKETI